MNLNDLIEAHPRAFKNTDPKDIDVDDPKTLKLVSELLLFLQKETDKKGKRQINVDSITEFKNGKLNIEVSNLYTEARGAIRFIEQINPKIKFNE